MTFAERPPGSEMSPAAVSFPAGRNPETEMSRILDFYRGTGTDGAGRLIAEVWGFGLEELEYHHDFIQWIFPLEQPSAFNPDAPLLTPSDRATFAASPDLQAGVLRSLDVMLNFYGFAREQSGIVPGATFVDRARHWATPNNHNHLRLSRIIRSLALLGRPLEAGWLQAACLSVSEALGPDRVSARSVQIWRSIDTRRM